MPGVLTCEKAHVDLTPAPEGRPVLEPWQRENFERALHSAPTVLETLFWGALLGFHGGWRLYIEELEITDLEGPPGEPDDFRGAEDSPSWE